MTAILSTLQVTDGTVTVDLNGTNSSGRAAFKDYVFRPPEKDEEEITESARVRFWDTSLANVLTTIRKLETLLSQAEEWTKYRRGTRVYVKGRADSTSDLYRALISSGRVEYDKEAFGAQLQAHTFWVDVEWTRGLWEADTEIELALLNGSIGAKQTGGITIYNHDDADSGHDDWVAIDDADVTGVVPAPVRLELTDTYASDQTFTLYLAHSAYLNYANFLHVLEGESGTAGAGVTGTPTANATCSGGNYMALSWAASSEITLVAWALTAAQIQACAGRWFRVLARFKTLPAASLTTRLAMSLPSALPLLSVSPERVLSTSDYLQDLGALRIPPWLPGESSCGALDLKLLATKTSGGSLDLDFLALLPADALRCLRTAGSTGAVNTDKVIDDGMLGLSYIQSAGGTKTAQLSTYGAPILLVPGRDQRLYVLAANQSGGSEILRTHSVRAYFRPRRLTL
jgi:hypothetical protein